MYIEFNSIFNSSSSRQVAVDRLSWRKADLRLRLASLAKGWAWTVGGGLGLDCRRRVGPGL